MRTVIKSAGACALAAVGLGIATSAASAAPAQTVPAQYVPVIAFPGSINTVGASDPGASVGANCPGWVGSDDVGLQFVSGNAVEYRIDPTTMQPNGGNVEGQAFLEGVNLDSNGNVVSTYTLPWVYTGHTHVWFGQNINPNFGATNDQNWFGETASFDGVASNGTKLTISASFGGGNSASGNTSGWLHVKATCS